MVSLMNSQVDSGNGLVLIRLQVIAWISYGNKELMPYGLIVPQLVLTHWPLEDMVVIPKV